MRIAIIGGGIGGLALALALRTVWRDRPDEIEVRVYEQARQFSRVGADINLTPNAVRALDPLGVGAAIRETAAKPRYRISRDGYSGEETSRLPMSQDAEQKYGAPQLTLHRGDLLEVLERAVGEEVRLGSRLERVEDTEEGHRLHFADGRTEFADIVVGADGIHSAVRTALFGTEHPIFTGVVAYRAVVPTRRLQEVMGSTGSASPADEVIDRTMIEDLDCFTKWWGDEPEKQVVVFPLTRGEETFIFATVARSSWTEESWTTPGRIEEVREAYSDFHPGARALLDACDDVLVSALHVRDPLPSWGNESVTLLGDACHPMMPFMAQGAGQAVEDAVVLARCLGSFPAGEALDRYTSARRERTASIQIGSRGNDWLRSGGNADWVYGYDAWQVEL